MCRRTKARGIAATEASPRLVEVAQRRCALTLKHCMPRKKQAWCLPCQLLWCKSTYMLHCKQDECSLARAWVRLGEPAKEYLKGVRAGQGADHTKHGTWEGFTNMAWTMVAEGQEQARAASLVLPTAGTGRQVRGRDLVANGMDASGLLHIQRGGMFGGRHGTVQTNGFQTSMQQFGMNARCFDLQQQHTLFHSCCQ